MEAGRMTTPEKTNHSRAAAHAANLRALALAMPEIQGGQGASVQVFRAHVQARVKRLKPQAM